MSLEVPMRTEGLLDMACSSVLRRERNGLEVRDVVCSTCENRVKREKKRRELTGVEEHVPHRSRLLVDLEWMAREEDPLRDDSRRIRAHESSHTHQLEI